MSFTKFVILSQERTGSTLTQMLLASDDQIISLGELFNDDESVRRKVPHQRYFLAEKKDPIHFLEKTVFKPWWETTEAIGFKLFYAHAYKRPWNEVWEYMATTPIRVIHVKRRNLLDRYLSLQLALRSDRWILEEGSKAPPPNDPIHIDPQACFANFHKTEWHYRDNEIRFRQHAVLDVWYETLANNTDGEIQRVLEFLRLTPRPLSTSMKKQRRKTKPELISNYRELEKALVRHVEQGGAKAEWLDFFDEE